MIASKENKIYRILFYIPGSFKKNDWSKTPPTPYPPSECVLPPPPPKAGGGGARVHTRRAVRGWWGVNISEDARHWIGLLQYNPSTPDIIADSAPQPWNVEDGLTQRE